MVQDGDNQGGNFQADELLEDLESMLSDQAQLKPNDLNLQLRLAKVHAKLQHKEAFQNDVRNIFALVKGQDRHPALMILRDLANGLGVDTQKIERPKDNAPQRRMGEDATSKAYFEKVNQQYQEIIAKADFVHEHDRSLLRHFNRPSTLMPCPQWSEYIGGAQIAIKREDMMGSTTKLTMAVSGQVLLAKQLGYSTVVTGSRNIRTGVLMASIAARVGLRSAVYLDEAAARQNSTSVLQMRCFGARIELVDRKNSARDQALDDCTDHAQKYFFVLGVDAAPAPFPELNQFLISSLGRELRAQAQSIYKRPPDLLVSRGDVTADAFGFFDPFLPLTNTRLIAVNALSSLERNASESEDIFSPNIQLSEAQLYHADAILEGSEYPSVSREHAHYKQTGRVEYKSGSVTEARRAITDLARLEGLIVPIRSAYALGGAAREAKLLDKDQLVVVNLVEQHDKDLREVAKMLGHDG